LIAISTREYVDGLVPEEREKLVDFVVGGVDEVAPSERRAKRIYQEVSTILLWTCAYLTCSTCLKMCSLPVSRVVGTSRVTITPISTITLRLVTSELGLGRVDADKQGNCAGGIP
jgi:hypothetical protein